jgi:hypothetical protein
VVLYVHHRVHPSHFLVSGADMTNRPARITQAEIQRVIRAGKKEGVAAVELKIGGETSVRIPLAPDKPIAEADEVVL